MLDLLLLRHAKSRRDEADTDDHGRDLAPRGEKAAWAVGRFLQREGLLPDLVLCSTARRTLRTWEIVAAAVAEPMTVRRRRGLYLASAGELLKTIRRQRAPISRLMLVGHNPGLQELAIALAGEGDPELRQQMSAKFPTAAVARLGFELSDWGDVAPGEGRLLGFWRPRDLA